MRKNFGKEVDNRVALATDDDFNAGGSSDAALEQLIVNECESGVFLVVLGGRSSLRNAFTETLDDKGNGNHAYFDNLAEAQRALVAQFGGTPFIVG